MGMTLPDLPQRSRGYRRSWRDAKAYLEKHGPSTVEEIVGEKNRQLSKNMATILRTNPQLFVVVSVNRRGRGKGSVYTWGLKDNV